MNFSKGQYVFSDIPGFDASKGERIVKALQRLWEKIEHLEQIRISEKKSKSEEMQINPKDEDLTITDVQYKLLVLQLQYARSILRKSLNKNVPVFHSKIRHSDQNSDVLDRQFIRRNKHRDFEDKVIPGEVEAEKISNVSEDVERTDAQVSTEDQLFKFKDHPEKLASTSHTTISSKPHYHLKLDDVPFILGASSTASHSVVANVQNIIAMMKYHNKALCGPKQVSKSIETASGRDTQDATKMLNDLSQDLYELALKQQKLVKSIDAAQGKNQASSSASKNFQTKNKKQTVDNHVRRLRSNSESEIKLHAEVKNFAKGRENDFVKHNAQQKQNVLKLRNQPSNLSIMDRRKLLRSLQSFKTHLSEEDISWD